MTTAFTNTGNAKRLLDEQVFALRQELYGKSTEKQKPNSKAKPIPMDELLPHNWKYLREQCQAQHPQAA